MIPALLVLAGPGGADAHAPVNAAAALAENQLHDGLLLDAGWRLAVGNAAFCSDATPQIGLLLQDVMLFDRPALARHTLALSGDIAIAAVAQGSPAAKAGLAPGQEVVSINHHPLSAFAAGKPGDYHRLGQIEALLHIALARDGIVSLTVRDSNGALRQFDIPAVPACRGRFELRNSGARAEAEGGRILIGRNFAAAMPAADRLGEAEFAGVVAHEFAHVLLGHEAWLKQADATDMEIRKTEREADRLAVWLLANAGYDPLPFAQLLQEWGARGRNGPPQVATHDDWPERAALARTEIAAMQAILLAHGAADWSRDFRREVMQR